MSKDKMKQGIILTSNKTLKKYEGKLVNDCLQDIRNDLQESLNKLLSDNHVFENDFPIIFNNDLGEWEIDSDGNVRVKPKKSMQTLNCKVIISKNNEFN